MREKDGSRGAVQYELGGLEDWLASRGWECAEAGSAAAQPSGHEHGFLVAKRFGLVRSRSAPSGGVTVFRCARTRRVVRQTVRGSTCPERLACGLRPGQEQARCPAHRVAGLAGATASRRGGAAGSRREPRGSWGQGSLNNRSSRSRGGTCPTKRLQQAAAVSGVQHSSRAGRCRV